MEAERRVITILFADLVGFTAFTERQGEEAAYVLMDAIHRLASQAVQAQRGTIKEVTGDGIIALFGIPLALEDAPLRACRAALSIQQRLADEADEFEATRGARPQLRISINTGLVIVGATEEGAGLAVFGDTVNTAARLQAMAPPGAILLSEAMHKLVRGLVDCEFTGLYPLRGKAEPQPAYRLDAVRQGVPRFELALARGLSPYIGRTCEPRRLERILLGAKRRLQVVDIVGEPGIGKSRLLHEFFSRSAEVDFLLSGSCSPDGRAVPFLPLIEIVRRCFGIARDQGHEAVARKLSDGLAALELFSSQNLALLLKLLGLGVPPESLADIPVDRRMGDLLQELLQARCRRSPLVVLLEDLQWIDGASEEVLARIVRAGDRSRLAIIHTRRPEYVPPWIDHPGITTLRLAPLSGVDTCRIVQHCVGGGELPGELVRAIEERSGGNPLFAEEIAGFLLERRVLRRETDGLEYDASAGAGALPLAVQSLLAARIDGLDQRDRAMLQAAAAIGRRFDVAILAAMIGDDGSVGKRLAALRELDILRPGDASHELVFRHALMRDTLYDSLLAPQRAALHLRIAAEIERRSSDRRIEAVEIVARRRRTPDRGTRASKPGSFAGEKSMAVCSVREAKRHFVRALEVAATFPLASGSQRSGSPSAPAAASRRKR